MLQPSSVLRREDFPLESAKSSRASSVFFRFCRDVICFGGWLDEGAVLRANDGSTIVSGVGLGGVSDVERVAGASFDDSPFFFFAFDFFFELDLVGSGMKVDLGREEDLSTEDFLDLVEAKIASISAMMGGRRKQDGGSRRSCNTRNMSAPLSN